MAAAIKFSIAVVEDDLNKLEDIAKLEDRSRNWVINKAIQLYLENYKNEGEK